MSARKVPSLFEKFRFGNAPARSANRGRWIRTVAPVPARRVPPGNPVGICQGRFVRRQVAASRRLTVRARGIFLLLVLAALLVALVRFLSEGGSNAQPAMAQVAEIPADRLTIWQPGLNAVGGIIHRTVVCATVSADAYGNGARNAAPGIQAAINGCPEGQVVQLTAGEFRIDERVFVNKPVTLRGRGPALTRLKMPPGKTENLITIGAVQWSTPSRTVDLAMDGVKGSRSVTLAKRLSPAAGELVIVDQLTEEGLNFWGHQCGPSDACRTWSTRPNRPLGQVMEVASVNGDLITFTNSSPYHFQDLPSCATFTTDRHFEGRGDSHSDVRGRRGPSSYRRR